MTYFWTKLLFAEFIKFNISNLFNNERKPFSEIEIWLTLMHYTRYIMKRDHMHKEIKRKLTNTEVWGQEMNGELSTSYSRG